MTDTTWHLPDPETQPEFYADVPLKRLLAWLVDFVLVLVVAILLLPFTAFTALLYFPVLFLTIDLVYRAGTIAQGSATWGMRLMAIEFRTRDGQRLDAFTAICHALGYAFSWAMPLLQLASVLLMATGPRGQGLTDFALGTAAVNRRAAS